MSVKSVDNSTIGSIKQEAKNNFSFGSRSSLNQQYVRQPTARSALEDYIDTVFHLPLEHSVPGLLALLSSGLQSHLSISGARLVIHPSYNGSYSLNSLAHRWRTQGNQFCESDRALLSTRLLHVDLITEFKRLYKESNQAIKSSWIAWLPAATRDFRIGCPCCFGEPRWCVQYNERCQDAFYFRKEVWKACFGDLDDESSLENDWHDNNSARARRRVATKSWHIAGQLQERWKCDRKLIEDTIRAQQEAIEIRPDSDGDWETVEKV